MAIDSSRRAKRSFTNEFKKQMVMLYQNGKNVRISSQRMTSPNQH